VYKRKVNNFLKFPFPREIIFVFIFFCYPRVELLVSHRVPPRVADRGMLARYGGYWGNKILGADQNQYHCLEVDRGICKG
jgi:hypothetical protein